MFSLVVDAASRCGSAVILVMLNERNQSGIYDAGDGRGGRKRNQQALNGSFSAVLKPILQVN